MTDQLHFQFYLILADFNLNWHMWVMATVLDSTVTDNKEV